MPNYDQAVRALNGELIFAKQELAIAQETIKNQQDHLFEVGRDFIKAKKELAEMTEKYECALQMINEQLDQLSQLGGDFIEVQAQLLALKSRQE